MWLTNQTNLTQGRRGTISLHPLRPCVSASKKVINHMETKRAFFSCLMPRRLRRLAKV